MRHACCVPPNRIDCERPLDHPVDTVFPPDALPPALMAEGYGVSFGTRVILADLHFEVPRLGITVLMGPVGTGKSTLLRSLAGLNNPSLNFRQWGRVECWGRVLGTENRPILVQQHIRLLSMSVYDHLIDGLRQQWTQGPQALQAHVEHTLTELHVPGLLPLLRVHTVDLPLLLQRIVAILGRALSGPHLLMVDEPTTGLTGSDEFLMMEVLRQIGLQRPLLVVLHNQRQARALASHVVLLAGGRTQAQCSPDEFFDNPPNPIAAQFVRTGSCDVPSPDTPREHLADHIAPQPELPLAAKMAVRVTPEYRGPTGFRWIIPGKLAGAAMPGVVHSVDHDLVALRTMGVTMLITLTENDFSQDDLHRHGLRNLHLPIRDREAPTVAQVKMLIARMDVLLRRGEVLAVHCLAGLGRTGTVLASWLIQDGLSARAALERIRKIEPGYVQSQEQEDFLQQVETDLRRRAQIQGFA